MLNIKTNNHRRAFLLREEVPVEVLKADLDWTEPEMRDGYFKYKGEWYHTDQFTVLQPRPGSGFDGWDAYHPHHAFAGVVLRLNGSDFESGYCIGAYSFEGPGFS